MSFLASRIMRAASGPRAGMELWWKSHIPVNGLITRHLSPFEVKVLEPLGKNFEKKTWARVRYFVVATLFFFFLSFFLLPLSTSLFLLHCLWAHSASEIFAVTLHVLCCARQSDV